MTPGSAESGDLSALMQPVLVGVLPEASFSALAAPLGWIIPATTVKFIRVQLATLTNYILCHTDDKISEWDQMDLKQGNLDMGDNGVSIFTDLCQRRVQPLPSVLEYFR